MTSERETSSDFANLSSFFTTFGVNLTVTFTPFFCESGSLGLPGRLAIFPLKKRANSIQKAAYFGPTITRNASPL